MLRNWLLPLLFGIALTVVFFPRLWRGGGFIGGDTYTYFLPQKAFLQDRLRAGEFPLWNSWTGHGYPLLGESQTAPLYPVNLIAYRWLDLNAAYVASHLLHYVAAFVAVWLLALRLGLSSCGAGLAGLVYVYGWFPPRACLEWAIIGGVYLPLAILCVEAWQHGGRRRWLAGLSLVFALDLLAGHFNLAFVTLLATVSYAVGNACLDWRRQSRESRLPERLDRVPVAATSSRPTAAPIEAPRDARTALRRLAATLIAIGLGFGLAAPQLLPSWDLKRHSQRTRANAEFDPAYGHIPPIYLAQVATPFLWYARGADPDRALNSGTLGGYPAATNKVEAHLYFGLLPLALAVWGCVRPLLGGPPLDRRLIVLLGIGLFGMVFATGWLLPLLQSVPGFGFFRGPGRYGLLTTIAVALTSGAVLSSWTRSCRSWRGPLIAAAVIAPTVYDLHWIAGHPWYTVTTATPIIARQRDSIVGRLLREASVSDATGDGGATVGPPRLLAPGPNLAALTGHAVTPPYLGFGPDAYYLPGGRLPDLRFLEFLSGDRTPAGVDVPAACRWLRQAGVTHILSMRPLPADWPIELLWTGSDPLLNPAWARGPWEPLFLYRLLNAPGRAWLEPAAPGDRVTIDSYRANEVVLTVAAAADTTLVLADLPWHEWEATLDGVPVAAVAAASLADSPPDSTASPADSAAASAESPSAAPVQRRLQLPAGQHRVVWSYRPASLWRGVAVALASAAALLALLRWSFQLRGHRDGRIAVAAAASGLRTSSAGPSERSS